MKFMNSSLKLVIIAVPVLLFTIASVAYWRYWAETQKKPDIVSISRFDSIFSKDQTLAVSMADIPDLRAVSLKGDDIEVRIWRAYDLPTLEGVFLKRIDGQWSSGLHIRFKTDEHGEVHATEVEQLKTPKVGWESFWSKIVNKGILQFPLTPENECDTKYIDGIRYVVEINQNNAYRNYQYSENHFECRESKQMSEIGEIIGLEFNSGKETCERFEWFACMTDRKAESLASPR